MCPQTTCQTCQESPGPGSSASAPRCYICWEPVPNNKSPCECAIPVHKNCLVTWIIKSSQMKCSVCRRSLHTPNRKILEVLHLSNRLLSLFLFIWCVVLMSNRQLCSQKQVERSQFKEDLMGHYLAFFLFAKYLTVKLPGLLLLWWHPAANAR